MDQMEWFAAQEAERELEQGRQFERASKEMLAGLLKPKGRVQMSDADPNYGKDMFPNSPKMTGVNAIQKPGDFEKDDTLPPPTGQTPKEVFDKSPGMFEHSVKADEADLVTFDKHGEELSRLDGVAVFPNSPGMIGNNRHGSNVLAREKPNE
jgi:hypothetical protein